jgi:uncharacterized membrane protein YfcA
MEIISYELIILLFTVALVAGFIDTLAGGGGLLTIPTLLYVGLSPSSALATNKLQGTIGTLTSSLYFIKNKFIDISEMKWMITLSFVGSAIGTLTILQLDSSFLKQVIPFLLIGIGIYFLLSPKLGEQEKKRKISIVTYSFTFAFIIGFYDGFFGPATGSFFVISIVFFLGSHLSKATAQAKVLNFVSNISSLIFFAMYGEISWLIGFIMIFGQIIGALIASKMIIKNGTKLIKPFIVVISFAISIKLLLDT